MDAPIFGAYSVLQTTYGGGATGPMWLLAEMRSDNTTYEFNVQNRSTSPQETIETFVTSADNNTTVAAWNNAYSGILQANTILDRIDPVAYADAAGKNRIIGEAKFLRALHYFTSCACSAPCRSLVHETAVVRERVQLDTDAGRLRAADGHRGRQGRDRQAADARGAACRPARSARRRARRRCCWPTSTCGRRTGRKRPPSCRP
jgi:hypothetical protein